MPENVADPQEAQGDSDDSDDGVAEEFAREWEALRDKVARIPDDIGAKLDQLLHLGGGNSANVSPQTRASRENQRHANPYPAGGDGQGTGVPSSAKQPDSKPETRHWYYRPLRRDK